ncbi:MAG: hypothetical protein AABX02_02190 [archaeon]
MVSTELLTTLGLFIVQMIVAVYLIRYSNQQLMGSISSLRDKNLELMKLNARLTKTVIMNEDNFRKEIDGIRMPKSTKTNKHETVAAVKNN